MMFNEIGKDSDFQAAVEYHGDIYLDGSQEQYLEENKAYASKNFSFASSQITNTLVYFLDYWLNNNRDPKIKFGFYSTNSVANEINAGRVKTLMINLPDKGILERVTTKDFDYPKVLPAVKAIMLDEYKLQYTNNKNHKLEESHYKTLENFSDTDWKQFLGMVTWMFDQPDVDALEEALLEQIRRTTAYGAITNGQERFVRSELYHELDSRLTKQKVEERFIDKDFVELTIRRVLAKGISDGGYKYLQLDYTEILQKTKLNLQTLVEKKYFSITGIRKAPILLQRKVALLDESLKLMSMVAEMHDRKKEYSIEGTLNSFINVDKPVLLFGELGSGKSTLIANHLLRELEVNPELLPVFIPSGYFLDKPVDSLEHVVVIINRYVNEELLLTEKFFELGAILKTNKEITLVVDGLDELPLQKANVLFGNLKKLKDSSARLRMLTSGRPTELQAIIPTGWQCLTTMPLTEEEIKLLLAHEAAVRNIPNVAQDTDTRFDLLKNKSELHSLATTPLIVCSVWPELTSSLSDKSLGDLLYNVLQTRLEWHAKDLKEPDISNFTNAFPHVLQREKLLVTIANEIYFSVERSITETTLFDIIDASVPENVQKNIIVNEAIKFFQWVFLQPTTDKRWGFVSMPLLECATGIYIADHLTDPGFKKETFVDHWRCLSFAMTAVRRKSKAAEVNSVMTAYVQTYLRWPNENVAVISTVVAELRDQALSQIFFQQLKNLSFRPVRTLTIEDHLTANSLAHCISLSNGSGFSWLFSEYLNGEHPLVHFHAKIASEVLSHYLIIRNYSIPENEIKQLEVIIRPSIAYRTSLCFELLPVLAIVCKDVLSIPERCRLLAGNLTSAYLRQRSQLILIELSVTNADDVLNALETACEQRDYNIYAAQLWATLNRSRPIAKSILECFTKCVSKNNLHTHYDTLTKYIPEPVLISYLRLCIILRNELHCPSSLILFYKGHRDFQLLAESLVNSIDWLDKNNYDNSDEINSYISDEGAAGLAVILRSIPFDNNLGIPPAFWKLFLAAITASDTIYLDEFTHALSGLRLYILTRYPDLRHLLRKLLTERPAYRIHVNSMMKSLDGTLRSAANAILLVCFPDTEHQALINVVKGFYNSLGVNNEWQKFCFSLNYSRESLQVLQGKVNRLVAGSKIYALALLYRHNISLSDQERKEMVDGLLSDGYFFDSIAIRGSDINSSILSDPRFFAQILANLKHDNLEISNHAASMLAQYHYERLDIRQQAGVWLIQNERYESHFFSFFKHTNLLSNVDFADGLREYSDYYESKKPGRKALLYQFYLAWTKQESWRAFITRFITKARQHDLYVLELLHEWLVSFIRKYPEHKSEISEALKEILDVPLFKENHDGGNDVYSQLVLTASEFDVIDKQRIHNVLNTFPVSMSTSQTYVALALKSKYDFSQVVNREPQGYVLLFAPYNPVFYTQVSNKEIDDLLVSDDDIPMEFFSTVARIVLNNQITPDQLSVLETKGNAGSFFSVLVNFCRNDKLPMQRILQAWRIGDSNYNQHRKGFMHKPVLKRILSNLLGEKENEKQFIASLRNELDNENNPDFCQTYYELISSGETLDFKHFVRMLLEVLDKPYNFRKDFAYELSDYFVTRIKDDEKEKYTKAIADFLSAISNRNQEDLVDDRYNLLLWVMSLGSIHLDNTLTDDLRLAFLNGLRFVFLEKNSLRRSMHNPPPNFFMAQDLLDYTWPLFSKIPTSTIKSLVEAGLNSEVIEISACCKILTALSGTPVK